MFYLLLAYTKRYMQQLFNNRYVRLVALTVGVSTLIYALLWTIFMVIGLEDFPALLHVGLSLLGGGLLVYKFLAGRVF